MLLLLLLLLKDLVQCRKGFACCRGHGCPGSLWVSDKRYAWFDLSANLTFYGPGPGGKGAVFQHSVPVLKHYKPEAASKAIIPDLVGLVWSACQVRQAYAGDFMH